MPDHTVPGLLIRAIQPADCLPIEQAFKAQGWNKRRDKYEYYCQEQQAGKRDVLLAEVDGEFAGYLTIVWSSGYPPFRKAGIPEISDFNVLKKFQRRGIGWTLMDEAEKRIAQRSEVAGIGVGLYVDYGAAQVMYSRRGYVLDGRGIMYDGQPVPPGATVRVDDALVIHFTKQL